MANQEKDQKRKDREDLVTAIRFIADSIEKGNVQVLAEVVTEAKQEFRITNFRGTVEHNSQEVKITISR